MTDNDISVETDGYYGGEGRAAQHELEVSIQPAHDPSMGPVPLREGHRRQRQNEAIKHQVTGVKVYYKYRCCIPDLKKENAIFIIGIL